MDLSLPATLLKVAENLPDELQLPLMPGLQPGMPEQATQQGCAQTPHPQRLSDCKRMLLQLQSFWQFVTQQEKSRTGPMSNPPVGVDFC